MKEKRLYKDYVKRLLDIFMVLGGLNLIIYSQIGGL